MKRSKWIVRLLSDPRRRYVAPKVEVEGPPVTRLAVHIIEKIADLASYEDHLTEAWFDYVTARRAVVRAEDELVDGDRREELIEAMRDARAAVMAELAVSLRMDPAEARLLAEQIDEAVGCVGTVAAA